MLLAKVKYVMNKIFRGIVKGQNNVLFEYIAKSYLTWIFHTRFNTAIYVAQKTRHANFELRMEELT